MSGRPDEHLPEVHPTEMTAAQTIAELAALLRKLRRRDARRRKGAQLTYRQLAAQAGWSHAIVAAYLTGRVLPPTDRFDTLIQLLGADPVEQRALATARDRVEERRHAPAPARDPLEEPQPGQTDPATVSYGHPVPRQIPAEVPGFVGRCDELTALDQLLALSQRSTTVAIVALVGTAGVGKTALALHWTHRVKRQFPHGQLYADLDGYGPHPPASPGRILDAFLAGLGVPAAAIPTAMDAKAALYRSLLHGRRLLIVLDNALSPQQVRPLLPGTPGCLVVVTSRNLLTGLVARDRAHRSELDVLAPDEALALLAEFVGPDRVAAEPAAARELVRLCAYLPVALCAIGERAAARSDTTLISLVAELGSADDPLGPLDVGDDRRTALRTLLDWSYQQLPPATARLFGQLGRHPGHDLDRDAAAKLAGLKPAEAGRLLEDLAAVSLLQRRRHGRYRMHHLLRAYATDRTRREQPGPDHPGPVKPPRPAAPGPEPAPTPAPSIPHPS